MSERVRHRVARSFFDDRALDEKGRLLDLAGLDRAEYFDSFHLDLRDHIRRVRQAEVEIPRDLRSDFFDEGRGRAGADVHGRDES